MPDRAGLNPFEEIHLTSGPTHRRTGRLKFRNSDYLRVN